MMKPLAAIAAIAMAASCSGSAAKSDAPVVRDTGPPPKITISGTVVGLASKVILRNNDTDDLMVTSAGNFAFATTLLTGEAYAVTVSSQPLGPSQECSVFNATGVAGTTDVKNVVVVCQTRSFKVGGSVTGLAGTGLRLASDGNELPIAANGTFMFATTKLSGAPFEVTIKQQPVNRSQTCTLSANTGVVPDTDVSSIVINCSTDRHVIGGTVTGHGTGTLVLQNNNGDDVTISAANFAFPTTVASGDPYSVTVKTSPATEVCVVTQGGSGVVSNADINSVRIACTPRTFSIGGTCTGACAGVALKNNGTDTLVLSNTGPFSFSSKLPTGSSYAVTFVRNGAVTIECIVTNGTGTVAASDVSNVTVVCTSFDL
jgi:trimeric autotransporter adhesin